jgi:hypothetical protein
MRDAVLKAAARKKKARFRLDSIAIAAARDYLAETGDTVTTETREHLINQAAATARRYLARKDPDKVRFYIAYREGKVWWWRLTAAATQEEIELATRQLVVALSNVAESAYSLQDYLSRRWPTLEHDRLRAHADGVVIGTRRWRMELDASRAKKAS